MINTKNIDWDLDFFHTGEWDVVQEKLEDLKRSRRIWNPGPDMLFDNLRLCPERDCKVLVVGQDPYPSAKYATGVAFSIPRHFAQKEFPPTLTNILKEYSNDLSLPFPQAGNLEAWANQGVLLWNAIPTCSAGRSLSHDWSEWEYLTSELVQRCQTAGAVIVFLGGVARRYSRYADGPGGCVIETSHPSPRGSERSKVPFVGSRLFSRINQELVLLDKPKIDWRL